MGFSTSGATAIIFVGLLLSVSASYPTLETSTERVSESRDVSEDRMLDRRNTEINVTKATYDSSNETLSVRVNNTGSTTLTISATDLVIDGEYRLPNETAVDGDVNRTVWAPGEQLRLLVENVETEPNRIKVVTEYGIAETVSGTAINTTSGGNLTLV